MVRIDFFPYEARSLKRIERVPRTLCKLPDDEIEASSKKLISTYKGDLGEDLVSEVRSFRR